jgi:hypothetical protein
MRVWAKGLLCLEAAVGLLIGHGTWLARAGFVTAAVTFGRDGLTGAVMASVDFQAALAAPPGRRAAVLVQRGADPGAGGKRRHRDSGPAV